LLYNINATNGGIRRGSPSNKRSEGENKGSGCTVSDGSGYHRKERRVVKKQIE